MDMFEKWKDRYERYWCTKDQLKRLVQLGVFTADQYEEITGEDYEFYTTDTTRRKKGD